MQLFNMYTSDINHTKEIIVRNIRVKEFIFIHILKPIYKYIITSGI